MAVSVVMPVFNASRYISLAIQSVLRQTYRDFEFIIVDDGSTDDTLAIIHRFAAQDTRIIFVSHSRRGVSDTLNGAIQLARNALIVRMDADDIMLPVRIERQVVFMDEHPEVALAACYCLNIDSRGKVIRKFVSEFTSAEAVRRAISHNRVIEACHPAIIMRKSVLTAIGGYRTKFLAEDLDLFNRMVEHGYGFLVQPEFLHAYRTHKDSASMSLLRGLSSELPWLQECTARRRRGEAELSWSEFLTLDQQASLWTRWQRSRANLARTFRRRALCSYAERSYLSFVLISLVSFLFLPDHTLRWLLARCVHARRPCSALSLDPSRGIARVA